MPEWLLIVLFLLRTCLSCDGFCLDSACRREWLDPAASSLDALLDRTTNLVREASK